MPSALFSSLPRAADLARTGFFYFKSPSITPPRPLRRKIQGTGAQEGASSFTDIKGSPWPRKKKGLPAPWALFAPRAREYNASVIMSGHSHWAGIKHKKEITDQKRGKIFSKLLAAISAAAKTEPNPDFNPRLRTAVQKAREASVPQENIERAIKRAAETGAALEELVFEAYGPGGIALLMTAISDNRNRTVQEVKLALKERGGKWAEEGSVRWAFEFAPSEDGSGIAWRAKFPQDVAPDDAAKLAALIEALEEVNDVQAVITNAAEAAEETQ